MSSTSSSSKSNSSVALVHSKKNSRRPETNHSDNGNPKEKPVGKRFPSHNPLENKRLKERVGDETTKEASSTPVVSNPPIPIGSEKTNLVAAHKPREENVRALAEAWGLLEGDSDNGDDDRASVDESAEQTLSHGVGLGSSKARQETNRSSLEARVELAQQRKKNRQQPSIELTDWIHEDDQDDEGICSTKSGISRRSKKSSMRVAKAFDRLAGGRSDVIHPLAVAEGKDMKQ